MPTYDFVCKDCSHRFSLFLSIKEKDQVRCPQCQSPAVSQLFTGFLYNKGAAGGEASTKSSGCSGKSCSGCSGC